MEPQDEYRYQYSSLPLAVERLQAIVLKVAEGIQPSEGEWEEYYALRQFLFGHNRLRDFVPPVVLQSVGFNTLELALRAEARDINSRQTRVISSFRPIMRAALQNDHGDAITLKFELESADAEPSLGGPVSGVVQASAWTGINSRPERIRATRSLLPAARLALEDLLAGLEGSGHNGGPHLVERQEAIDALRNLHLSLGEIIAAIDQNHFDDELGEGLGAASVRYAKVALANLRDDPIPFAAASLLISVFSVCGFPGAGAFLASMTLEARRR